MKTRYKLIAFAVAATTLAACDPDKLPTTSTPPPPPKTTPVSTRVIVTITGTVTGAAGMPVEGALVKVNSSTQAVTRSDGSYEARFTFDVQYPIALTIDKTGYLTGRRLMSVTTAIPAAVADFAINELERVPIDDKISGTISGDDPYGYVGEDYDSDYAYNMKFYTFTTDADDLIVELSWSHVGNAALVMWTQGGPIKSEAIGDRQRIRLPRNTSGNLIVGQPYEAGKLSQAVPFTLESKRAGG